MITMRVMTIFIVTKETVVWRINKFSVKKTRNSKHWCMQVCSL